MWKTILEELQSTRNWAIILGAFIFYLKTKGFIGESEAIFIDSILGLYIVKKTSDHFSNIE